MNCLIADSLADHVCLSCFEDLALNILTAEKVWKISTLAVNVRVIR